jgi:AcrR family transcriptional regulator
MNNTGPAVRNRGVDRRVVRTRRALGDALMRLLRERSLESITVQDVLDAAGVGRATFYGHFRGKQDLLLSHFESVMAWMDAKLRLMGPNRGAWPQWPSSFRTPPTPGSRSPRWPRPGSWTRCGTWDARTWTR